MEELTGGSKAMMKRAFTVLLMVGFSAGVAQAQGKGGNVPWNTDPKEAIEKAKKTGKPMMLYFTSQG